MEINIDNYNRDVTENGVKTFLSNGKIGIQNIGNGKKTIPSFDRVIISNRYIFVKVNGCWGILDIDFSLILPPIYKEIFPVNIVDRDSFIADCLSNKLTEINSLNSNCSQPRYIAIQKKIKVSTHYRYGLPIDNFPFEEFKEDEKAYIFETINSFEDSETDLFVTISDEDIQLVNISEYDVKNEKDYNGYNFFLLYHYKDNMFIVRNNNGSFVTSEYNDGRFGAKTLFGEFNDGFKEYGSPQIVLHRGEFVSVIYPNHYSIMGFPNTEQFKNKENDFLKKSGKWALFKYIHKEVDNSMREKSYFEQLTSFVFEEPMTQTQDENAFICHGDSNDFFMRFEQNVVGTVESLKVDEKYQTKVCSQGQLKIVACYDSIEQQEDGSFEISTKEGSGLCDEKMNEIIPARYDRIISDLKPLMIVEKNERYGVVNDVGKDIVPCVYDTIKISKDNITIWNVETDYDPLLEQRTSRRYLGCYNDSTSSESIMKEGYFIVCINNMENPERSILKNLRFIPNYYSGQRVLGSNCDVYLPNGRLIVYYERIPAGGIQYFKDYDAIMRYEKCLYDIDYGMFYNYVQLDFFNLNKRSSMLEQALLLNNHFFLANDCKGHIGIGTNNSEDSQSEKRNDCSWALPAIYSRLSLPMNDIIYAFRYNDDKQIVDIIDIKTKAKVVLSVENKSDIYTELNNIDAGYLNEELKDRLIKKDDSSKLVFFPFVEYYDDGG